jgi:rubredoxin
MEETKNWRNCSGCRYTFRAKMPHEACPSCGEKCAFIDATCYTPECGGLGNVDPQVSRL